MSAKRESPFYIYLNSSDLNSYSSTNSNTFFVNLLGETIHLPSSQDWCVALKSLTCSNTLEIDTEEKSAGLIKVKTSLIQPTFGQERVLAVCTRERPDNQQQRLVHFEPENKSFYPLSTDLLSLIDITLTDIEDNQLKFALGAPTLIVLEFRRMTDKSEFTIRVNSQDDKGGSAADFGVQLPPMLSHDPNQKWSVSLSSLIYDGKFDSIPLSDHEKKITVKYLNTTQSVPSITSLDIYVPLTNTREGRNFTKNIELAKIFQLSLSKALYEDESKQMEVKNAGYEEDGLQLFNTILFNPETEIFKFATRMPTTLIIPYRLAIMLGSTRTPDENGNIVYELSTGQLFSFEEPMKFNIWIPTFLLLYCNFIEYSHIGNALAPVLKTIPIHLNKDEKEFKTYESVSQELHRVSFSQLSNLKFKLKTVDGRDAPFNSGNATVVLTLKFVKQ